MMLHIVSVSALLCLALMTGNEICVALFVNPVLRSMPEAEQLPAVAKTAARLGAGMPPWYAVSLLLTIAMAVMLHRLVGWMSGASLSVVVQVVVLVMTLAWMVPLNNKLAKLDMADRGWPPDAERWDALHRVRVGLLLAATVALAV